MRGSLIIRTAVALGAYVPYAQQGLVPHPRADIADPVGLIAAEPIPPPGRPGLLTVAAYGVAAGATAVDVVLMGAVPP